MIRDIHYYVLLAVMKHCPSSLILMLIEISEGSRCHDLPLNRYVD